VRTMFACFMMLASLGSSALAGSKTNSTQTDGRNAVSVMAYNVENLFDTKHDEGKADWAYLPLTLKDATVRAECDKIPVYPWKMECLHLDWTDAVLAIKMQNVADAILAINNGRGPDVLMLEEVENIGVLNQLNTYLAAAGYTTAILIEGNDDRGIDQAMLSRLPVIEAPVNDPIPLIDNSKGRKEASRTRGLLHTTFALPDGTPLTVFGVHFPSGDAAHGQRVQAIDFLNEKRAALPADRLVIVGGDFNINRGEDTKNAVYEQNLSPWLISHQIGCAGCVGTEYYKTKKEWSFLDAIGFSKNLDSAAQSAWSVDEASIQIPQTESEQTKADGTPNSFNAVDGTGVSDHLPVFAILRKN
jgi:endonuclease/exonuclease/phosphatase family metal-dependent hydrolase